MHLRSRTVLVGLIDDCRSPATRTSLALLLLGLDLLPESSPELWNTDNG